METANLKDGHQDAGMSNKRIQKNVAVIGLVFAFNFMAYHGLSELQSSLHIDEGMGVYTQSIVYAALASTALFVPKLLIRCLGHKWTITVSLIGYILWIAANGYAVWGTMVTGSLLLGLCAAPLWIAQSSYLAISSVRYAKANGYKNHAGTLALFCGIFYTFVQLSFIGGSLISYFVLKRGADNYTTPTDYDLTFCGLNDCPWNNVTHQNLTRTPTGTVWVLVGVSLTLATAGLVLSIAAVDPLPSCWLDPPSGSTREEILSSLTAGVKHMVDRRQMLLIPLSVYRGLAIGFYAADFNHSFVTCVLGIHMVGLVNFPVAVTSAATGTLFGRLVKYTGQLPVIATGLAIELSIQMILLLWTPSPTAAYIFFLIACLRGVSGAVLQAQLNALYGILFPDTSEAAFSNLRMWQSIGLIIAFSCSDLLCTAYKIYIFTSVLVTGSICYFIIVIKFKPYATVLLTDGAGKECVQDIDNLELKIQEEG